jgi:hypothetical protein
MFMGINSTSYEVKSPLVLHFEVGACPHQVELANEPLKDYNSLIMGTFAMF